MHNIFKITLFGKFSKNYSRTFPSIHIIKMKVRFKSLENCTEVLKCTTRMIVNKAINARKNSIDETSQQITSMLSFNGFQDK